MWWCGGFHHQTLTGRGFGYRYKVVAVVAVVVVVVVVSGGCCNRDTAVRIGSSSTVNTLKIFNLSSARTQ